MTLVLLALGGGLVVGVLWLLVVLSKPTALTRMSDDWLNGKKYNRRQDRPD